MIKDYLNEKTIQLKQKANNCEEAIRKAAIPLIKEGKILEGYVEQMLSALKELGPYMVILPGIALAHARPSDNVKEDCMSMMTLVEPVMFGHWKNDPVHTIFVLASPNSNQHLEVLKSISQLLSKEEFIDELNRCYELEDITKYFN